MGIVDKSKLYIKRTLTRYIKAWLNEDAAQQTELMRSKLKHCGWGVTFRSPILLSAPEKVSIGNNVHFGLNTMVMGDGGLTIGDHTHFSHNLIIYTGNHNYNGECLPYDTTYIYKPVVIGKNVWVGINVTIVPGVTIGDGAIIGAGTVVERDVPPLAIIGSQPFRILKYRDSHHYWELEEAGKYGGLAGIPLTDMRD